MPSRLPQYRWDAELARYRNASTGRLVASSEIRRALDRAIEAEGRRARALADGSRAGTVTLREFEAGMREVVKNTQLFSAAAARGGWAQMDARAYGQVGASVRRQYAFLAQFRDELRAGLPKDGMFARRAASYAEAGRPLYHAIERDVMRGADKREERSRRNARESCADCIAQELLEWQPLGAAIPIGQRRCLNGCQCEMEYR